MRLSLAFAAPLALGLAVTLAACGPKAKRADPDAPRPDDVPTVLTCCVGTDAAGDPTYETVPEAQCPEDSRNPLDTCDLGPGETPRKQ
jgi:hypothetical protein